MQSGINKSKYIDSVCTENHHNQQTLSLKEACWLLRISEATGRNWVKNRRLVPMRNHLGKMCFVMGDIQVLVDSIENGLVPHLKTRRNKKHKTGFVFPVGYLSQSVYEKGARAIVEAVQYREIEKNQAIFIIAEQSIRLLQLRGLVPLCEQRSYLLAYLQGDLNLGECKRLLDDLLGGVDRKYLTDEFIEALLIFETPNCFDEDYLGLLYTTLQCVGKRKAKGVYYTPLKVVNESLKVLISSCDKGLEGKVLDPCCGTGQFLMQAFKMKSGSCKSLQQNDSTYLGFYGFDCDPVSIFLTRINMVLISGQIHLEALYQQFKIQDTLAHPNAQRYDLILGNPPWAYTYDESQMCKLRATYALAKHTRVESYGLFVEWAIHHLKESGILMFVLPESILSVKYHRPIRQFLIDHVLVRGVFFLENAFYGVFMPAVTLVFEKKSLETNLKPIEVFQKGKQYSIQYNQRIEEETFQLRATDEALSSIYHMENQCRTRLKAYVVFAMGIVTGDNLNAISYAHNSGTEPILTGREVKAFVLDPPRVFIKSNYSQYQQFAPLAYYRISEKLVYKFISGSLVVAYDATGYLTLNSCNCLIPVDPSTSIFVLLSFLNSEALQYYFRNKYGSTKVLKSHLEALPVPDLKNEAKAKLECLCKKLLTYPSDSDRIRHLSELNRVVWETYGFGVGGKPIPLF